MRRLCCLWVMVCLCGCDVARSAEDYRDAAAVDLAISTMSDASRPGPSPAKCSRCDGTGWITHGDGHRTRCPECQTGSAGQYGNPLDTYRDAKALLAKGNELADRGKALLDAAEADGKIMLAVHLPKTLKPARTAEAKPADDQTCPGGVCPCKPKETRKPKDKVSTFRATILRTEGVSRPRLLERIRR
jgi:hypothetical protein